MTAPLLELADVSVTFQQKTGWLGGTPKPVRALTRVSMAVHAGETLALVGESGSGKTTLGHVIVGLRAPDTGTLALRGKPIEKAAQREIQLIFQDTFSALDPRMTVAALIEEPLRIQGIGSQKERRAKTAHLIDAVGLPQDAINRYPHTFSGGQRQRIAIARALAPDPTLIVADEPLSALDPSVQSQIINLLKQCQRARNLGYLFISHDLGVVNHLADRVAVLYLGRLVEIAPTASLFERPAHPYTSALMAAVPRIGRRRQRGTAILSGEIPTPLSPPPGCAFHPRCPRAADICRHETPELAPVGGDASRLAACHFAGVG
jgi:peptide/nickel transport system ATP-binding protein/oligopeptide transport system ATP-binding protein